MIPAAMRPRDPTDGATKQKSSSNLPECFLTTLAFPALRLLLFIYFLSVIHSSILFLGPFFHYSFLSNFLIFLPFFILLLLLVFFTRLVLIFKE